MPHVCAINRCQSRNFNGSQFNCGRSVTLSIHGLASAEWSHSGPGPGLVGQPQTSSYPGNIIFTHRKCILYSSINKYTVPPVEPFLGFYLVEINTSQVTHPLPGVTTLTPSWGLEHIEAIESWMAELYFFMPPWTVQVVTQSSIVLL